VVKPAAALLLVASLGSGVARFAAAQSIYEWKDEQGSPHYSNRGGMSPGESGTPSGSEGGERGWESVLERKRGDGDFQGKAEAAINSMELQVTRKKRERLRAQEELEATQANIVRALRSSPADVPILKAREATQITALRKTDLEIGLLEMRVAKLRALKEAEKEQRSAP
jgi:Domain of unknown function (DUF4124)